MNRVLVTGANGYVGNFIMKTCAGKMPATQFLGMSRRGTLREGDLQVTKMENVKAIRGDCLNQQTYPEELKTTDAVIHCVGGLVEGKTYETTYDALNRDSCIRIAQKLDEYAKERNTKLKFVMISSEKAPPFLERYLTTKLEAEQYLVNECKNLHPIIIRPGFIVNQAERSWSAPLQYPVNILSMINSNVVQKFVPGAKCVDFLFPAHST